MVVDEDILFIITSLRKQVFTATAQVDIRKSAGCSWDFKRCSCRLHMQGAFKWIKSLSALSPVVAVCGCNSLLASNNLWLKSPLTFLCCCVFALLRLKNGFVFPPQPEKKKNNNNKKKQPSQRIYYILFWCVHFLKKITKKNKKTSVVIYPVCSSSPSLCVSLGVLCDCLWVHIYTEIGRGVVTAWERCTVV